MPRFNCENKNMSLYCDRNVVGDARASGGDRLSPVINHNDTINATFIGSIVARQARLPRRLVGHQ